MRFAVAVLAATLFSGTLLTGSQIYTTLDPPGSVSTNAWAISNSGLIGGYYSTAAGTFGFVYNPADQKYSTIIYPSAFNETEVLGINDNGDVAGSFRDASGNTHGFIDVNGQYTEIVGPGSFYTIVRGINDSGQLSVAYAPNSNNIAYRWTKDGNGGYTKESLSIGSFGTGAQGINNHGDIVGYYQTPNYVSYLWNSNGTSSAFSRPNDLNTTVANGINDNGAIVGSAFQDGHISGFELVNGVYTTINPPNSTYTYATGINTKGNIVGWYESPDGRTHAFLLTETVTPEPASAGSMAAGCLGLLWRAARKRRLKSLGSGPIK